MDVDLLVSLALEHKWLPALAVLVGFLIRLLKADVRGPSIPKKLRAPLAFALGFLAGTLQRKSAGARWPEALLAGLLTGCLPILGHRVFIEKLRKGLELPIPGLMKDKAEHRDNRPDDDDDDHHNGSAAIVTKRPI